MISLVVSELTSHSSC